MIDLFELDNYSIYQIFQEPNNPYAFIVATANHYLHCYSESEFAHYANLDNKNVWSIKNKDIPLLEKILNEEKISFKKIDYKNDYIAFLKETFNITESIEKCDSFYSFGEMEVTQISGFRVSLRDGYIKSKGFNPKDKILFYIHSNEFCPHSQPHVHVKVKGKCYNYCAIDLTNLKVLAHCREANERVINEVTQKLSEILPEAKKAWNEQSKSLLTFEANGEGFLTDKLIKRNK